MIAQRLLIKRYGWQLNVFYAVHSYFVEDITAELRKIGCPDNFIAEARENMAAQRLNRGLTYSNYRRRATVMVIGLASSPGEYANSIAHELWHFAVHLSRALGLDIEGEDPAYLIGDTMMAMMPAVVPLLCGGQESACLCQIAAEH